MSYDEPTSVVSVFSNDMDSIASYEMEMVARFNHNFELTQSKFILQVDIS